MKSSAEVLNILDQALDNGLSVFLDGEDVKVKVIKNKNVDAKLMNLLKTHKQEIKSFLYKKRQDEKGNIANYEIAPFDRTKVDEIPLSFAQERLWFIDKLEGSVHYHIPGVLRLKGKLDIAILEDAFKTIVNRHEVLRTVFDESDGIIYQNFLPLDAWQLENIVCEDTWSEKEITGIIRSKLKTPFDLSKDYLLRGTLLQLSEEENLLLVVMHHIASDGWSIPILLEELSTLYTAKKENREAILKDLSIQYADYALWQRRLLPPDIYDTDLEYWSQKLSQVTPLNLPTDFPRPSVQSRGGNTVSMKLSKELLNQLQSLAHQEDVTIFMVLLTAFKTLLFRYSGEQDICVGSPIANRTIHEIEPLIGYFVNTIALRSDLAGNPSFSELLQQVKTTTLEAYAHQEVPFEKVVDRMVKSRDRSRSPLFQVLFVLQNNRNNLTDLKLGDLELSSETPAYESSKFDLTFTTTETNNGLDLVVEYCSDLYLPTTVKQMMQHFEKLLYSVVVTPQTKIETLKMLTAVEQQKIIIEFNDSEVGYPKNKTIVDLFEAQVLETPDNVAVVFEDAKLTYQELNEQANQVAHYLIKKGVQAESLVGICLERSLDMIVGILGIIKAGGAYVPIDPTYPQQRIDYILEDAKIQWMLTQSSATKVLESAQNLDLILLDKDRKLVAKESNVSPQVKLDSSNIIYVIYTSGTTGNPKGVMLEHNNLVRLFKTEKALFDFGKEDVWTMFHSFCFDFSVWEMYGALLFGGKLVVVPDEVRKDTIAYAKLIYAEGVTVLNQTPSSFRLLQDICTETYAETPIRYVIFGGEALDPSTLQPWKTAYPDCALINMYGITETTVHVTYKEITAQDIKLGWSNIGQAIPTLKCYILDDAMNVVPIGVAGEIFVSGAGVARGYLNRPELTAERFIDNPFSDSAEDKLYKTGDLAKWLNAGEMEYLGRKDDQVKIRGYRIELGEVEAALGTCEWVKDRVVLAKSDQHGNNKLVAYIVPNGAFNQEAIQEDLKTKLPDYMVPSLMVEMKEIPLTSNGKVNKKVLPNPSITSIVTTQYLAPRNEAEEKIEKIWGVILDLDHIGVRDNFFNIGGDSIIIIRVISALKRTFNREISVADFYQAPTIEQLAQILGGNGPVDETRRNRYLAATKHVEELNDAIMAILPDAETVEEVYPMSDIQKGMAFASLMNQNAGIYHDQPLCALPFGDLELCGKALALLVEKHPSLRTSFNLHDYSEEIQIIHKNVPFFMDIIDLSELDADEQRSQIHAYMEEERQRPFDFKEAPLWRATIFKTGLEKIVFLFQCHHIIVDGWSIASMNTEFVQLYTQLLENPIYKPQKLKSSYKEAIIESLVDRQDEQAIEFWKKELSEYKRLNIFSEKEDFETFVKILEKKTLDQLLQLAQDKSLSLKTIFFGAYLYALKMLTYEQDLTIGMVSNNRPLSEDGDKIIGCFLNTLPVRTQLTDETISTWQTYLDYLENKLTQLRNQGRLTLYEISKINGERTTDGNPFFDVLFNYIDFHILQDLNNSSFDLKDEAGMKLDGFERTNTYLDLTVDYTDDQLRFKFSLQRQLKSGLNLEGFYTYFERTLQAIAKNYEGKIQAEAIMPPLQSNRLLEDFNQNILAYSKDQSMIDLFENQVKENPQKIALVCGDTELTYEKLNQQANQLAHYLKGLGVAPQSLVAICMDRNEQMIVAMLGVLKAGATYVPIDPNYPTERIHYILEDAAAKYILSSQNNLALVEESSDTQIILLDKDWGSIEQSPDTDLKLSFERNHLCYIIYTSGSTGKPKGVMIANKNTQAFLAWCHQEFNASAFEIVYAVTSICFDLSIFEIFYTLSTGKKLRLLENAISISQYLEKDQAILLNTVPTVINNLLEDGADLSQVNVINMAGEPIPKSIIDQLDLTRIEARNLYGPSEDTTYSTCYRLQADQALLIGQPIANTQAYVLDQDLNLLPPGVIGELCLSGDGVSLGYLKRPKLTAEKFITNPFAKYKNQKLYRTGDLVRWLPDGNLDFLGRKDNLVKIRGYRIELGEVETFMDQMDCIKQSIVLAKIDASGTKNLVAYIVPEGVFDRALIQDTLKAQLPEYMVPTMMVEMDAMPLTPNGKVNRKALPDPDSTQLVENEYMAPRNEMEQQLATIWCTLLRQEQVGVYDNFFELGGHSLLASRLVARVRKEMEIELNIKAVFAQPTIHELSLLLNNSEQGLLLPAVEFVKEKSAQIPLSYAQERLWFLEKLSGTTSYHIPFIQAFKADLKLDVLGYALNAMVNRHEILRTVIREENNAAYQTILPLDIWTLDHQKIEEELLSEKVEEAINEPFDLANDHMLRATIFELPDQAYVFVLVMHHIASDGWSSSIMLREIMELYRAKIAQRSAQISPLNLQYTDYALWQRNYLSGEILEGKLKYWENKLKGLTPLNLPIDFARPAEQSSNGSAIYFEIDHILTTALYQLCQKEGVTPFMLLLSALKVLLHQYTGQTDVCIGSPIANRTQKDLEDLIGFFVNTLALRSDLGGNPSFQALLSQVKATTLEAYQHQETPFEKIVDRVVTARDRSTSPLFQVMFILQNIAGEFNWAEEEGLLLEELVNYSEAKNKALNTREISRFDLTFVAIENAGALKLKIGYCTDLFKRETILRMKDHLLQLLNALTEAPHQKINSLPILTQAEQQQLLVDFNNTAVPYPKDKTLIGLFEDQVNETPNHTAVSYLDRALTYQQLNEQSNALAHYLLANFKIQAEDFIALELERNEWAIMALLAIMKTGAAYVPIDPNYPRERKAFLREDSTCQIVVDQNLINDFIAQQDQFSTASVDVNIEPQHLAYMIYTSGTTGNPKGVMIEHQSVVNTILTQVKRFKITPSSKVLQLTSLSFDASVAHIFRALLAGAQLGIISDEEKVSTEGFERYMLETGITVAAVPPVYLQHVRMSTFSGLDVLATGGDAANLQDVKTFLQYGTFVNCYGPTEASICASMYLLEKGTKFSLPTVPIGRPIDNAQICILNEYQKMVPIGMKGELHIGGRGLARGYWNRPKLTREKFINHPYQAGALLYRTGDLARWLPDGNIEFLGRKDDQVKIRGYRIELGEIEMALDQCESVNQNVVLAKEDTNGTKKLVAYIVPTGDYDKLAIQNFLKTKLPEYMIPALMVEMEEMPLTPNGKVDRKALPNPDLSQLVSHAYVAPRNETEQQVAIIWQEMLNLEQVGVYDNFFELGGHSLLAMRVVSMIRETLEVDLVVKDIFTHPTLETLSAVIANKEKGLLLPPVKALENKPQQLPLSYAQERLWFLDQLGGTANYHLPFVQGFTLDLDQAALEFALQNLVNRHEILRTIIGEKEGKSYQTALPLNQWEMSKDSIAKNEMEAAITNEINTPFDLSKDPMLRAKLLQVGEEGYMLVLVLHHIAADGWSVGILLQEIMELYQAYVEQREHNLSPLTVQYGDYAHWQRKYFTNTLLDQKLNYWEDKLQGLTPLELPLDFSRPTIQSTKGSSYSIVINKKIKDQLNQRCQQEGVTLFMLLLSAFQVMLYRYSGQTDICIGSPVANRNQKELEGLIGFFVNTIAMRSDLSGNPSFLDLLAQVKATTLDGFKHQDVPFEKIVDRVITDRDPSRSPLFQVMFTLQNATGDLAEINEFFETITWKPEHDLPTYETSKFDLTLAVAEEENGLKLNLEYCTDLFKESTIVRMASHFEKLLTAIISTPEKKLDALDILPEVEKLTLLHTFNDTQLPFPKDKTVVALFAEQVALHPDRIAASHHGVELTYEELDKRSNQLAHYLQSKGVKEETLVGLCLDRSLDMITAILGVSKAGGAYVPIDTRYPQNRIDYILEDCAAQVVLTHTEHREQVKTFQDRVVWMDQDWETIMQQPTTMPIVALTPNNLAYVIYTSGSTGQPKGVMIEHAALINLVTWHNKDYRVTAESRATFLAGVGFDASVWEFWPYLLTGAALYVIENDERLSPNVLVDLFQQYQITHSFLPTALVVDFVKATYDQPMTLECLLTGGDRLSFLDSSKVNYRLINNYGPTENTVVSTFYDLENQDLSLVPPIGKPISNVEIFILDQQGKLLPVGVPGELCVGGASLARGYWNRPELTAEKFVAHPFKENSNEKIYKTGDLARWLPDGNIEFIGRTDNQVKIRGYRIELGEIEAALNQCEAVHQNVVIASNEKSGHKNLVAYIVANGTFDKAAIQTYLQSKLPEYMVPALMVEMQALPLNANGKVDRKALPIPDYTELTSHEYIAPRNTQEQVLANIWQELLGIERVGIHDNFFELGGHSLLATQVVSQIRKRLEIEVAVKDIFTFPSLEQFSRSLQEKERGLRLPPVKAMERTLDHFPLSYDQERFWFLDQMSGSANYHIPHVQGFKKDLDVKVLEYALNAMVNRHEILRTVIGEEQGESFQTLLPENSWILVQETIARVELEAAIAEETNRPFDLTTDHALRAKLFRVEDYYVLVLVMHHIASDGWSVNVLLRETMELYVAKLENRAPQLPALDIQYLDYANWQRTYLSGELLEQKLNYWEKQLEDVAPLNLPLDHKRPREQSTCGSSLSFEVNETLTSALKDLSREEEVTLFILILTAFKILLYRYSGQTDICVGTPVAKRTQKELEHLIGFFVNTLALRSDLSDNPSFPDLLAKIKAMTLESFGHQEVPFEKIVERVMVERDTSRSPLFQVAFTLQNEQSASPQANLLSEISRPVSEELLAHSTSKFDLTLFAVETNGKLEMNIEYCTDLFEASTMHRLRDHFISLLNSIAAEPKNEINSLSLLADEEQETLLKRFNNTIVEYPEKQTVVGLFMAQASRTPDSIAINYLDQALTYAELNLQSNQLAHRLQKQGIGKGDLVGLYVDRSLEMVIGILGILKSGAAYVPLDAQYPAERIAYIIEDANMQVMLCDAEKESALQAYEGLNVMVLEADLWSAFPTTPVSTNIGALDAIYMMYTSGSTGVPKGVMIKHQGVTRLIFNPALSFLNETSVVYQFASTAFDASTFELWGALLKGGKLIISKAGQSTLEEVGQDFKKYGVTVHWLTAALFHFAVDTYPELFEGLTHILAGGESINMENVAKIISRYPNLTFINGYGPTEVTTFSTTQKIEQVEDIVNERYVIGYPIGNTKAYILDQTNQLLPIGCPGELCLSGPGLSLGYYKKPELTASKFIANPFATSNHEMIYRTGDLVRWLPNGMIEFIGRIDNQVKIRGYRIELGGILSTLEQCELVRQSVVVVKEDNHGNKNLVAYVVPEGAFDKAGIRSYLQTKLADYMIPSQWIEMETLPVNANGKIDRKALPEPDFILQNTQEYIAPRSATEKQLAAIWCEVLDREKVGLLDNFFEIGGHSILATKVISNIKRQLNIELSIKDIFTYPTLESLANAMSNKEQGLVLPPMQASSVPGEKFPLSYAQERLWFLDQLGTTINYHLPYVQGFTAALDLEALSFSLQTIVNRHEALRTVLLEEDGLAYQNVLPVDEWQLEIEKAEFSDLKNLVETELSRPFDLTADYMLRTKIFELPDQSYLMVLVMHHISADGWSIGVLQREIKTIYEAKLQGKDIDLPDLEIQYKDYAKWQRTHLAGDLLEQELTYWEGQLSEVKPLNLPLDYARPPVQSSKGSSLSFEIEEPLTNELYHRCRQEEVTPFMLLLTTFKVLLYRYSGQTDICVGSPIANRTRKEVEGLIGFFVNTLALRSDLSANPSFRGLLSEVKAMTLEGFKHQDTPFEKIVERVVTDRDTSRSPLFQVMFTLQNASQEANDVAEKGLLFEDLIQPIKDYVPAYEMSKFDLTMTIVETHGKLRINLEYCTDLFRTSTILRMQEHFRELLSTVVSNPAQPINNLSMLTEKEEQKLMVDFNNNILNYPADQNLISLFETQVELHPEQTAIIFDETALSYEDLNKRANQVAHYLRQKGLVDESLVAICMDRSIEMIVAMLGVLKSGGAYVPIDPAYPTERIHYILEDAKTNYVISDTENKHLIETRANLELLLLDGNKEEITKESTGNLNLSFSSDHLFYVIYTSGSTGKPKGVMITNKNTQAFLHWSLEEFGKSPFETVYAVTSICFDLSIFEIFYTLSVGKRMRLLENGLSIEKYLDQDSGVLLNTVPTVIGNLLDEEIDLSAVNVINMAGEPIPQNIIDRLDLERIEVRNLYGPSEDTTYSTVYRIEPNRPLLIGRPIANTQVYITDENLNLLPEGSIGELCLSGEGVSRGYLNRPELTQEKFQENPFSIKHARLYCTGDLARWLPDGNLEFLGRKDAQVKIRGYRIELGEIETRLEQSEWVQQAVVLAPTDERGNKRLVAYIVPNGTFQKENIHTFLKDKLPDFMVPAVMIEMAELPRTPNGKVDKKALVNPELANLASVEFVAPRNEVEIKLAAIWQALLRLEKIGVYDNFFELGGHSLLATRVVSQIRKHLEIEVAVKDIFAYPTIDQLGRALGGMEQGLLLPTIEAMADKGERHPLSYAQERLWFLDRMSGSSNYHMPYIQAFNADLKEEILEYALNTVINRHEVLRTVIREEQGESFQVIMPENSWQLATTTITASELRKAIAEEIKRPFDLTTDHTLRGKLFSVENGESILVLVMHHIASDGWSLNVLLHEIMELYQAKLEQRTTHLAPLEVQYSDYAHWQRKYLTGAILDQKLTYWEQQLKEVTPLNLPLDHSRPRIQSTKGSALSFDINKDLAQALNDLSRQQGVTLFMLLLTAFKVLLYRYSGQTDISVGSPVANRNQKELEGLIGFFVNTIALRSDLAGNPTFNDLLGEVKAMTLEGYEHQDVPFERIVDRVIEKRDTSRSPLFQVVFTLQNIVESSFVEDSLFDGIAGTMPEKIAEHNTSKFDLMLSAVEVGGKLKMNMEYCTDLFEASTMQRLSDHFVTLLASIVQSPEKEIDGLVMLTAPEKISLLETFNDTVVDYPDQETVATLFSKQATQTPQNIALNYQGNELTYEELETQSNQVAHYLQAKGIGKEALVGMYMDRSLEMVIVIIGIIKSGAAYVPIDAQYPAERIAFIIEDTAMNLMFCDASKEEKLTAQDSLEVIVQEEKTWKDAGTNEVKSEASSTDPIYMMYTSGSTGKPKGVLTKHQGVTRLVFNPSLDYLREDTVMYQYAPTAFDASTLELWGALLKGGTLIVAGAGQKTMEEIGQDIQTYGVNTMWLTSGLFHLGADMYPEIFKGINYLLAGGDSINLESVQKLKGRYPNLVFINGYGPTETTTFALTHRINEMDGIALDRNIIGRPIGNTKIYILDESSHLLPIGCPGELCISGPGLALGYHGRPELTAQQFVENPYASEGHELIYRTGDLARWLIDGTVEFLGRVDNQVKIRGYRIELSGIESTLEQCDLVRQSVVLIKEDINRNKHLIAYLIPEGDFDKTGILAYLQTKLAEYMIPNQLIALDAFPLNHNGKVDRKALPEPAWMSREEQAFMAPRNEEETIIRRIWAEVLSLSEDKISINDNFFEIGGNSLSSIKLISQLQAHFQLTINDLFLNPTIMQLGEVAEYEPGYLKNKLESHLIKLRAKEFIERVAGTKIEASKKEGEKLLAIQKEPYINGFNDFKKLNLKHKINYEHILLLGATGYLGIHLLYELLQQTTATFHLIVRGNDPENARARFKSKFNFYINDDFEKIAPRLKILQGDMEKDHFGLSPSTYDHLSDEIDCVINSAANVKHYGLLEAFKKVNTDAIEDLLTFCETGKQKVFHQISTPSVSGIINSETAEEGDETIFKESDIDKGQLHINFYAQSKMEAEVIIERARARGVQANIYRVGNLSYHSKTGRFQENIENNAFYNQIRMFLKLGCIPEDLGSFEISNIDLTAKAFATLFDKNALVNRNFHLYNPNRIEIKTFVKYLNRKNLFEVLTSRFKKNGKHKKTKVECVELKTFFENVLDQYDDLEDQINRLFLQFNIFDEEDLEKRPFHVCTEETIFLLHKLGFKWPKISPKSVQQMLKYGQDIEFFK